MNPALRGMEDDELGRALASGLVWPETPSVAPGVLARIAEVERAPRRLRPRFSLPSRRRTVLILIAALLAVAAAAAAAKLVIDFGAVRIREAPTPPLHVPSAVPSGSAFGRPTTLAEAEAETGLDAVVPPALGSPDRAWTDTGVPDATRIVLAWRASPDLPAIDGLPWGTVLYEFRGDAAVAVKTLGEGTQLRTTRIGGHVAYFITGEHEIALLTDDGTYARYSVAGNVLLWQEGGLTLRLETELPIGAARKMAGS